MGEGGAKADGSKWPIVIVCETISWQRVICEVVSEKDENEKGQSDSTDGSELALHMANPDSIHDNTYPQAPPGVIPVQRPRNKPLAPQIKRNKEEEKSKAIDFREISMGYLKDDYRYI